VIYGEGVDPSRGLNLETMLIERNCNGKMKWAILQSYNDVTRRVAKEENLPLVDLAVLLPKDSRYFYDTMHYNNEGSIVVAEIIYNYLKPHLLQKFGEYQRR
jgi:lysophospholipase L1-like esterase